MKTPILPEVWLRGPLPAIPSLLQPVAHALLQAREEVMALMKGFPSALLWERPAGVASPGFHLQHLSGVLDRLFTYARGGSLDQGQLEALGEEGKRGAGGRSSDEAAGDEELTELLERFDRQVDRALRQLETTSEEELTQVRGVGRARIPSTVLGLLFHAAEHTQRHNGQLLVTVKVLLGEKRPSGNPPGKDGV
ncbi:MAG TPA: DinB family protein [Puia sp.]|nr:DinB family protein [Puia sp.]